MGQLVHQGNRGVTADDRVSIQLLDDDPFVRDLLTRHHFERRGQLRRLAAPMRFEKADNYVGSALLTPKQLFERRVRLADTRRDAQINPVASARARASLAADAVQHLLGARPAIS